jgi:hypothetical protein
MNKNVLEFKRKTGREFERKFQDPWHKTKPITVAALSKA